MLRTTVASFAAVAALLSASPVFAQQSPPPAPETAGAVAADQERAAALRQALAPYGTFRQHERYGEVWVPSVTPAGWQPFPACHWVYTKDYGWFFDDRTPWGSIVHHYGRWALDAAMGWVWVPGDQFSPGAVVWNTTIAGKVGWAPAVPGIDEANAQAIYQDQRLWVFTDAKQMGVACGAAPKLSYSAPPPAPVVSAYAPAPAAAAPLPPTIYLPRPSVEVAYAPPPPVFLPPFFFPHGHGPHGHGPHGPHPDGPKDKGPKGPETGDSGGKGGSGSGGSGSGGSGSSGSGSGGSGSGGSGSGGSGGSGAGGGKGPGQAGTPKPFPFPHPLPFPPKVPPKGPIKPMPFPPKVDQAGPFLPKPPVVLPGKGLPKPGQLGQLNPQPLPPKAKLPGSFHPSKLQPRPVLTTQFKARPMQTWRAQAHVSRPVMRPAATHAMPRQSFNRVQAASSYGPRRF